MTIHLIRSHCNVQQSLWRSIIKQMLIIISGDLYDQDKIELHIIEGSKRYKTIFLQFCIFNEISWYVHHNLEQSWMIMNDWSSSWSCKHFLSDMQQHYCTTLKQYHVISHALKKRMKFWNANHLKTLLALILI